MRLTGGSREARTQVVVQPIYLKSEIVGMRTGGKQLAWGVKRVIKTNLALAYPLRLTHLPGKDHGSILLSSLIAGLRGGAGLRAG